MSATTKVLETQIMMALEKGFKATFVMGAGDDSNEMALNFAKAAAPEIATAIQTFVQNAQITGSPLGLISPVGPVTGAVAPMSLKIITL